MTTTQDTGAIVAARQAIIEQLDDLSLRQLGEVRALINSLRGLPQGMSGKDFLDLMLGLRDKYHITDEEADDFDRILRADTTGRARSRQGQVSGRFSWMSAICSIARWQPWRR